MDPKKISVEIHAKSTMTYKYTNLCFNDEFPQIFDCRVTFIPVNILVAVFEVDKFTLIPRYPREDGEQEKRCY